MSTYGGFPGVKVTTDTDEITPGIGYPRDYEELYAQVSVGAGGQIIMTAQQGEDFGNFGEHKITYVKGDEHFSASCCRCGHRMVAPLDRVEDAADSARRRLRYYMAGFFLDVDCDMRAVEAAEDVAQHYLGKMATNETKRNLKIETQQAIHDVAEEEGRVTHLG